MGHDEVPLAGAIWCPANRDSPIWPVPTIIYGADGRLGPPHISRGFRFSAPFYFCFLSRSSFCCSILCCAIPLLRLVRGARARANGILPTARQLTVGGGQLLSSSTSSVLCVLCCVFVLSINRYRTTTMNSARTLFIEITGVGRAVNHTGGAL